MGGSRSTGREPQGITGDLSRLYDVFVDWPGRLGRELPGIGRHLAAAGARRVLDAGCGTGRHVQALLERGYDALGADLSTDMLEQAAQLLGGGQRLRRWRLGEPPGAELLADAPFDAVLCLGNVWPMLVSEEQAQGAARGLRQLLRPGGLLLLGLKAFALRAAQGQPYLPLLRREHAGRALWFVRFVDFDVPAPEAGVQACDLHMTVVAGDAQAGEQATEALIHRATRVRAWSPDGLRAWFEAAGFEQVRVSGRLDDPEAPPQGEDVYVSMRTPRA